MKKTKLLSFLASGVMLLSCAAAGGCADDGKITIRLLQYKPEAVSVFEAFEKGFNETHDDIRLIIESPNDAMTVLKTRLIRENPPDIVGIGGDINYSDFLDSGLFADISDFSGVSSIKPEYIEILEELEFIPMEGVYALPYAGNAAGILYNKDIFDENGWTIPTTWTEFNRLCEDIQAKGIQPLYFGYKDVWTTLAPWNAIAVGVTPSDTCNRVNAGETTFFEEYQEVAEKTKALLKYGEADPFSYGYNDACIAFAREQAAMFPIGSYAVPQILSSNPDLNIDSFVFPANEKEEDNVLNSGIDLLFSVMSTCRHKDAAYEVLEYLYRDEMIQSYLHSQNSLSCKKGNFEIPEMLNGMRPYIEAGRLADYQDHHYPAAMSVDAMIQTFLMDDDTKEVQDAFLKKFDKEWKRYNRDLINKVQNYHKGEK